MKLEIIKSKHGWKIISRSNKKHPALMDLGSILMNSNKSTKTKLGVFNVYGGEFSNFVNVFSYISGKTEKLNRKDFYNWKNGKRQLKNKTVDWQTDENSLFVDIGSQVCGEEI